MKKTLSLALALVMILGVTVAYADGTMNKEGLNFPELPNNTLTLTVSTANFGSDALNTKMQKLWQEKMESYLGCTLDITWQTMPWNDFRANESVMLAASDLADINTYSQGSLVNEYGADGDVLNINKYADYLVFYPDFVAGKAGGQDGVNNADGSSYVFWDGYENDLNLAGAQSFTAYGYRFDVLKAHDLQPAANWTEFVELCAKLKVLIDEGKVDAKYVMSNGASWMNFYRGFVGTFHTWDTTYWNGKEWAYGPIEDNFRAMLIELNKLYAAGYIDPEYATDASCDAKASNGNLLVVPTMWAGSVASWNSAAANDQIEWGLAYLPSHADYGTAWKWGSKLTGKNLGTTLTMGIIINAETEYPEWVVRLVDYQYSEDIYKMLNWGIEGEDFITLEDGTRTYVDALKNSDNPGQALADLGIMASGGARTGIPFVPQIFSTILSYSAEEPWWSAEKGYYMGKYWIDSAINGGPDSVSPYDRAPLVDLTEEESTFKATLSSACESYAKVEANKFITGELDPSNDEQWAAYVTGVKSQVANFDEFFKLMNEKTDLESLEYYK
ncbi:MAG: hypothetical protein ACOX58_13430 [Christensenellales bacterium]|jgi:putative aldouronate transport system substrate-binding protein